ncbi:3'-5' exonuclease [Clostridium aestuarii]|uniref:3'-5' exonuclease n=1 Tax=Clostridium aestuarii TaxID=338193 RepID=A0ABT4CWF8_9CLOT|nr:3'-5' exonuclease [Clostridium aestuarii]MCY6483347.1 3'-5' exonuclease [Clostridium aestuarii]
MKSIFLDTETTGLKPGRIVQLTYIIEENKKFSRAKNFFFMVEDWEMDERAAQVHGFTVDRLAVLSNGQLFEDAVDEIKEDFKDGIFIAHNSNFDKKFIDAEFGKLNISCNTKREFCTMKYFKDILKLPARRGNGYKNPKVEEVMHFYDIDADYVLEKTKKIFDCEDISFHDARYDTMAMYICCLKSQNRNIDV